MSLDWLKLSSINPNTSITVLQLACKSLNANINFLVKTFHACVDCNFQTMKIQMGPTNTAN